MVIIRRTFSYLDNTVFKTTLALYVLNWSTPIRFGALTKNILPCLVMCNVMHKLVPELDLSYEKRLKTLDASPLKLSFRC